MKMSTHINAYEQHKVAIGIGILILLFIIGFIALSATGYFSEKTTIDAGKKIAPTAVIIAGSGTTVAENDTNGTGSEVKNVVVTNEPVKKYNSIDDINPYELKHKDLIEFKAIPHVDKYNTLSFIESSKIKKRYVDEKQAKEIREKCHGPLYLEECFFTAIYEGYELYNGRLFYIELSDIKLKA